ncbi:TolC family protein [Niabella sp.]|uniref:TolC family protein n=1 Tax=Niabella sp. TaxID=1962976 RepID=UPI0026049966|nr:TolC family protein [Niabella sp.]
MKKQLFLAAFVAAFMPAGAQYFNEEVSNLYRAAAANNDTLQLYQIRKQATDIDIQTARFSYLPRVQLGASYTHLNDAIVFPDNLQQLLQGTQQLLIKEKLGLPFNAELPAGVSLQPVPPIQKQDIVKANVNGQWLLFGGMKVRNGIQAYQHQQRSVDYMTQKQDRALWLDVSEAYDRLALLHESDAIIRSSENVLDEQTKFVKAAIQNGLATPLDRKKIELAQQRLAVKKLENSSNKTVLISRLHQLTSVSEEDLLRLKPEIVPAYFDVNTVPAERPEIKALDEGMEARKYKGRAELAEYVPKLAAFGQYELRNKDLSLFDPRWAVGLKLQWNLFDGLSARNNARKETLEKRALEVQKKSAQERIKLGYAKSRADYELATGKVLLKNQEANLSQSTYDFVQKQYVNGLTNITELLNALNDVEKARFENKQAIYEQRRAALLAADLSGTLLKNQ